jgi:hypothetical protein
MTTATPPYTALPQAAPSARSSKRVIVLWAIALALLLGLGLFCWLVVVPVWRVNAVLAQVYNDQLPREKAVAELGGGEVALRRLRAYLRAPRWLARYKTEGALLACHCGDGATDMLADALKSLDSRTRRELIVLTMIQRDSSGQRVKNADGKLVRRPPKPPEDGRAPLREALKRYFNEDNVENRDQ